jgi:hypothetical protein
MTEDTKHKGIHDPWRLGTDDWQPPHDERPVGAAGSNDEFDADLAPDTWYVFRVPGAGLKVMDVHNPTTAAWKLLKLFKEDKRFRQVLSDAGFVDDGTAKGFVINGPQGTLCCPEATSTDNGLLRAVRALRASIRADRTLKQHFNKLGIIPLVE